jgi:hypothetical protein
MTRCFSVTLQLVFVAGVVDQCCNLCHHSEVYAHEIVGFRIRGLPTSPASRFADLLALWSFRQGGPRYGRESLAVQVRVNRYIRECLWVTENVETPQIQMESQMKKLTVSKSRLVELNRDQVEFAGRAPGTTFIRTVCPTSGLFNCGTPPVGVDPFGVNSRQQAVQSL